jgi:hypothetical protein
MCLWARLLYVRYENMDPGAVYVFPFAKAGYIDTEERCLRHHRHYHCYHY